MAGAQLVPVPAEQTAEPDGVEEQRQRAEPTPSRPTSRAAAGSPPGRARATPRPRRRRAAALRSVTFGRTATTRISATTVSAGVDPEDALPVEPADEQAGERKSDAAADPQRGTDERDALARLVRRQRLLGDAHAEGDHGDAAALQGAADDEHEDVRSDGGDHAADASSARATMTIRRLPYMSPSRPKTGLETAPVRKAAVATHDTLLTDVFELVGEQRQQRERDGLGDRDERTAVPEHGDDRRRRVARRGSALAVTRAVAAGPSRHATAGGPNLTIPSTACSIEAMDFTFSAEDEAFRIEVRTWIGEHLVGEFAELGTGERSRRGPRARRAAGVGARAGRRRLGRHRLADRVRRSRSADHPTTDLQRGVRPRRRPEPHRLLRRATARTDVDGVRHRGAEAAVPAADPACRRVLVSGLQRARRRFRSRQREDDCRAATATSG